MCDHKASDVMESIDNEQMYLVYFSAEMIDKMDVIEGGEYAANNAHT